MVRACKSLLLLLSFFISHAYASDIQVTVSKNKVAKNEVFELVVLVTDIVKRDALDLSSLKQGFYLGTPRFSSSRNSINGRSFNRSQWVIPIAAQSLGIVKIPSLSVGQLQSAEIAIQVVNQVAEIADEDIGAIKLSVAKTSLMPQESTEVTLTVEVLANTRQLQNTQISEPVVEQGTLTKVGEAQQSEKIRNGRRITLVEQKFLFQAENAGRVTVSPSTFSGTYFYRDPSNNRVLQHNFNLVSESPEITVNAKPENYQGMWLPAKSLEISQQFIDSNGDQVSIDNLSLEQGQALTRIITLTASGITIEQLPDIQITYPAGLQNYPEKPLFRSNGVQSSSMSIKHVIVAQNQGDYTLPGINVNWWNTESDQMQNAELNSVEMVVLPIENAVTQPILTQSKSTTVTETSTNLWWPISTLCFAFLWLTTLALLLKQRHLNKMTTTAKVQTRDLSPIDHAISVVESEDCAKINDSLTLLLQSDSMIPAELSNAISTELAQMHQSHYSLDQSSWSNKRLIEILKNCKKTTKLPNSKTSNLATL